jgi:cytidylate kinase
MNAKMESPATKPSEHEKAEGDAHRQESLAKVIVVIDGGPKSGKYSVGRKLAVFSNALLVDSGRIYRAFTKACLEAGLNLDDGTAVADFCKSRALDLRFRRPDGFVIEAQIAINGRWFTKTELKSLNLEIPKVARVPEVREFTTQVLHQCKGIANLVVLGRDIGSVVFSNARYKYFLKSAALELDHLDAEHVQIAEDATIIDTRNSPPDAIVGGILSDMGYVLDEKFRLVLGNDSQRRP